MPFTRFPVTIDPFLDSLDSCPPLSGKVTFSGDDLVSCLTEQHRWIEATGIPPHSKTTSSYDYYLIAAASQSSRSQRPVTATSTQKSSSTLSRTQEVHRYEGEVRTRNRIGREVMEIKRLHGEVFAWKVKELEPLWDLLEKGARICLNVFLSDVFGSALEQCQQQDHVMWLWTADMRRLLQDMYARHSVGTKAKHRRETLLKKLEKLEENLVWCGKFLKGYITSEYVNPMKEDSIRKVNEIGRRIIEFIEKRKDLIAKEAELED
jgi:hypothetical protein